MVFPILVHYKLVTIDETILSEKLNHDYIIYVGRHQMNIVDWSHPQTAV